MVCNPSKFQNNMAKMITFRKPFVYTQELAGKNWYINWVPLGQSKNPGKKSKWHLDVDQMSLFCAFFFFHRVFVLLFNQRHLSYEYHKHAFIIIAINKNSVQEIFPDWGEVCAHTHTHKNFLAPLKMFICQYIVRTNKFYYIYSSSKLSVFFFFFLLFTDSVDVSLIWWWIKYIHAHWY